MPEELTKILGNFVVQFPMVAIVAYLWFRDRKEKLNEIKFLREENKEKTDIMDKFVAAMDRLALSLELIKDRLR
jgi:hypothetical protein